MRSLMTYKITIAVAAILTANMMWAATCRYTPLVLDLGKNGIHLGERNVGIYFDINGDSIPDYIQWVDEKGDEGFVGIDINNNGVIDDGRELFGSGTLLQLEGTLARNGFIALAQYDDPTLGGNDDGLITAQDSVWASLILWVDSNADGVSTIDEVKTLQEFGLVSLETIPKRSMGRDGNNNWLPLRAWAETTKGKLKIVDVFFAQVSD